MRPTPKMPAPKMPTPTRPRAPAKAAPPGGPQIPAPRYTLWAAAGLAGIASLIWLGGLGLWQLAGWLAR